MRCIKIKYSKDYRYGFNGQEKDNEVKGTGNSLAYEARIYDSRLGVWLSNDPCKDKYPSVSPYSFGLGSPIQFKDEGGRWITDVNGKPIYTYSKTIVETTKDGKYYYVAELLNYYLNDGTPVVVTKYLSQIKVENAKFIRDKVIDISVGNEPIPEDKAYDCHGNSCFPGENLYIAGEENGKDNVDIIFNNKSEYDDVTIGLKEGDIKLFKMGYKTSHSATRDNNGTYTSKDDREPKRTGISVSDMEGDDVSKGQWGESQYGHKRHKGNTNGGVESNNGEVSQEVANQAIENVKKTK